MGISVFGWLVAWLFGDLVVCFLSLFFGCLGLVWGCVFVYFRFSGFFSPFLDRVSLYTYDCSETHFANWPPNHKCFPGTGVKGTSHYMWFGGTVLKVAVTGTKMAGAQRH